MTKLRDPATIEDALVRIANQVPGSYVTMALVCGECSPSLVRAWGDPDKRERMPADVIVPLELLYEEHGGQGYPISHVLEIDRQSGRAERFGKNFELARVAVDLVRESGEAGSALIAASLPGASADARRAALKEAVELDAVLGRLIPELRDG